MAEDDSEVAGQGEGGVMSCLLVMAIVSIRTFTPRGTELTITARMATFQPREVPCSPSVKPRASLRTPTTALRSREAESALAKEAEDDDER